MSKLREHWEETASAVTSRRDQLESLLSDSHTFERRRQDADLWLGRMEHRLAKLAPIGQTADLIDVQHREHKVIGSTHQVYLVMRCKIALRFPGLAERHPAVQRPSGSVIAAYGSAGAQLPA